MPPEKATLAFDPATRRIVAADDAACASLGLSREELLGREIVLRSSDTTEHAEGTDPLTGLPDRRAFSLRLAAALAEAAAKPERCFAVLFLDLDGFKAVNDRLGHLAGDRVLAEIARRLAAAVRPGDLVARFGGDEFTVFLDGLRAEADAAAVARRLQARVEEPVPGAESLGLSASVGVAVSWTRYADANAMLHAADRAMYRAKTAAVLSRSERRRWEGVAAQPTPTGGRAVVECTLPSLPAPANRPMPALSRPEALELLHAWTKNPSLLNHARAVEIAMRAAAARYGAAADAERWALAGLLHDADYDQWPAEHPRRIVAWLRDRGEEEIAHAVSAHNTNLGVPAESGMDKALLACDELAGFIVACSLVRPEGVATLAAKGVKKKLKDKAFAAKVDREEIRHGAERLGVDLEEHIQFVIDALRPHAAELGIAGTGAAGA